MAAAIFVLDQGQRNRRRGPRVFRDNMYADELMAIYRLSRSCIVERCEIVRVDLQRYTNSFYTLISSEISLSAVSLYELPDGSKLSVFELSGGYRL